MISVRIRVRIRLRSGCSDYNLATLQSDVLKFRTDVLSVLDWVKRLLYGLYCIDVPVGLICKGGQLTN